MTNTLKVKSGASSLLSAVALALALGGAPLLSNAANDDSLSLSAESVVKALTAPDGWVEGYLAEEESKELQALTKSYEPVRVRFTVVKRFAQKGCGRVQVDVSQEGVPTKDFKTVTFVAPPIQINLCEDAEPPQQAPDVTEATSKARAASLKAVEGEKGK